MYRIEPSGASGLLLGAIEAFGRGSRVRLGMCRVWRCLLSRLSFLVGLHGFTGTAASVVVEGLV